MFAEGVAVDSRDETDAAASAKTLRKGTLREHLIRGQGFAQEFKLTLG